ncbi:MULTISPECIES: MBL fold metallo-hydrolase [unclassified Halorhabdus]|uniref:MBL fold metallo-hydrolase n=1 Tax=unclassified Halorhabdus TaxID=2621901 RepID=UPI0023DC4806|nr:MULTISPECIES: MBL fold metallo-hydrolase [unclassified Halorhabdus]WEL18183.1 Zn-dependent hydrolase of the beta-lactamase fold [Halorhabdus sp. SVX81]WEL22061.1 Zn-dependent hydrolase of the beta-lactamase fold [Halorhabdus sp. BNX81]
MVTSDWGEWLPAAIENTTPDGVAIWYLGCNGFVLKDGAGTTIFIDPYLGTGDPPRTVRMLPVPFDPRDVAAADAIVVTHDHVDHVHGPSQAPILAETGATFYAPDASLAVAEQAGWTDEWDVADGQLSSVSIGETIEIGAFTLHVADANDPDAEEPVSYVIEHEAGTFFHGGDARPGAFESIGERFDIDLGVLAFGSVGMVPDAIGETPTRTRWYNDENMIVEAANELELDALLPSHWDMWKGMTADPTALYDHVRSFPYPKRLDIVEIGDRIDL